MNQLIPRTPKQSQVVFVPNYFNSLELAVSDFMHTMVPEPEDHRESEREQEKWEHDDITPTPSVLSRKNGTPEGVMALAESLARGKKLIKKEIKNI